MKVFSHALSIATCGIRNFIDIPNGTDVHIFPLIKAATTLLGTDPVRFFEFGTAPKLEVIPYATWQELTISPFNTMEAPPSTDFIKIQIDVWGQTAEEARDVAHEVRRAIDQRGEITFGSNSWDEESNLYRSTLHFTYAKEI